MKRSILIGLLFGVPYGVVMIVFKSFKNGVVNNESILFGIVSAIIAGSLFSLVIKYLTGKLFKSITIEINKDEELIKEGGANHFKGKEGVGGKLALTNKRLIFKSHKMNIQNHEQAFDFSEMKTIKETKTLNILKNGLMLELINNEFHKFIVDDPSDWVKVIEVQKKDFQCVV